MKPGRLIASVGMAIVASSSALLAGAPAASADTGTDVTFSVANCTYHVTVYEDRDENGARVDLYIHNSCGAGFEGGIKGPDGTPHSYGGDVKNAGDQSITGYIPTNSGNHHGFRYWYNSQWNYHWVD
jgi:hypothetical protein